MPSDRTGGTARGRADALEQLPKGPIAFSASLSLVGPLVAARRPIVDLAGGLLAWLLER